MTGARRIALAVALLLAACGNGVNENAPQQAAPTAAANPGPAPSSAPRTPVGTDMAWVIRDDLALYGPPESEAVLSFTCEEQPDGRRFAFADWLVGAPFRPHMVQDMSFLGAEGDAFVRVSSEESMIGGSLWRGPVLNPDALAQVLRAGPIEARLETGETLALPASAEAADFIANCETARP